MKRSLALIALPVLFLLTGCPENVPNVECAWDLPGAEIDRLPSAEGFTLRVEVAGIWEAEELPAVRFSSDVDGELFLSSIAIDDAGCEEGCAAGQRYEEPVSPGAHTFKAEALTPQGAVACEATRALTVNTPPTVDSLTVTPENPMTGEDVTYVAVTSDVDGDEVSVSNFWSGPEGQELVGDTLTNIQTSVGQLWTLSAVPRDGFDAGVAFTLELTIANTPPLAPTVAISPVPGRIEAALVCEVLDLDELDPDDQELTVSWSWTRDGSDAGVDGAIVAPELIGADETWVCSAVVSDGVHDSPVGTATSDVVDSLAVPTTLALDDQNVITGIAGSQFTGDVGTVGSPGDIDGDGLADLVLTVNDDVCDVFCDGQAHAYFFAGSSPMPTSLDDADADFLVPAGFKAYAPWRAGDLNGDGIDDLVLPHRTVTPTTAGGSAVYILFGSVDGFTGTIDLALADGSSQIINGDGFEIAVAPCPLGDVDGDGYDDLGIAAPYAEQTTGRLYVIYGHPGAWLSGLDVGAVLPAFQIQGSGAGQTMGQACAGPLDIDGNGIDDVVVSASGGAAQGQGRVLIYLMDGTRLSGSHSSSTADTIVDGDPSGPGGFGTSLAGLGDHDGDGFDDFAIFGFGPVTTNPDPPPNTFDAGTAWIMAGGDLLPAGVAHDEIPYEIVGEGDLGFCGHPAGVDMNGDGLGDLVCGDTRPQQAELLTEAASVRVFLGSSGVMATDRTRQDADLVLTSPVFDHLAGLAVAGLPDRDGDHYDELLVGAPGRDGPLVDSGAVYLINLAE
jgi:hypothetical protein